MQGTLAAGKTTITKGIAKALEIEEDITSPTFTLISEYEGKLPLYHMDVYRLDSTEDFINLGTEDLIYGKGISIIEWSEKVMEALPKSTIILKLEAQTDDSRIISISNFENKDFLEKVKKYESSRN
jgi:tRNA threonylcarbamoyladenosine biosynthesis protein TsaE